MAMLRLCLLALLGHWRRHPLQLFAILTGLWLATALWAGVQALNSQARADYARARALLAGPAQAQLVARRGERFAQVAYLQLRRAGWPVSPLLEGRLYFAGAEPLSVRLLGIEPLTLPRDVAVAGQLVSAFDLRAFLGPPGQAWIAADTLQRLGLRAGEGALTRDGQRLPSLQVQAQLAPGVIVQRVGSAPSRTTPVPSRLKPGMPAIAGSATGRNEVSAVKTTKSKCRVLTHWVGSFRNAGFGPI